jgi:hypothetical protein
MAFPMPGAPNAALEPIAFFIFTPTELTECEQKIKPSTEVLGPIFSRNIAFAIVALPEER